MCPPDRAKVSRARSGPAGAEAPPPEEPQPDQSFLQLVAFVLLSFVTGQVARHLLMR